MTGRVLAWNAIAFVAVTVSVGEMVAVGTLLFAILAAVVGSYVSIIRRLDKQDATREALSVEIQTVKRDVKRMDGEISLIRKRVTGK